MPEWLLETKGLRKRFGAREVVRGVDLQVGAGEIVGLLGKNGAGKTTTFRMVMGLLRPNEGRVYFRGEDVSRLPMYRRARLGMGYLAQEPSVFTRMTVADNIRSVLELVGVGREELEQRLEGLIAELGLVKVRNSRASTLSGGERRRLEVARALAANPSLLLFDEPFSGIDPIAVFEIQEIIHELKKKGLGVLLTDHNVRETLSITDRAYIMEEGAVWLQGTPAELVTNPEARRLYLGEKFMMDAPAGAGREGPGAGLSGSTGGTSQEGQCGSSSSRPAG